MIRSNSKILVAILLVISRMACIGQVMDQAACQNNLSAANSLYEKAQFNEAIALIEPCLKSGKLKRYETDAWRIIALCYLQLNDVSKTESSILKLLHHNPDYQLYPYNDPKEFTQTLSAFAVEQKWSLGLSAGFNYSAPYIKKAYAVKTSEISISGALGQFLGAQADYLLKRKKCGVSAWALYNTMNYSLKVKFNENENLESFVQYGMVDAGASFKAYPLLKNKFHPFIGLGVNANTLISGIGNIRYTNSYTEAKIESSRELEKMPVHKLLWNANAEIGGCMKAGKGDLGISVAYFYCLTNLTDPDKRYDDLGYILNNQYLDSDVMLHSYKVKLTYSFPLLWRVYKK